MSKDKLIALLAVLLFSLMPSRAESSPKSIAEVKRKIDQLRIKISYLQRSYKELKIASGTSISDLFFLAQERFENKDYLTASVYLYEIVNNPKAKNNPFFLDAVYLLAESLFKLKNYVGASKYYRYLIKASVKYRGKSLTRAMEIASITKNYKLLQKYFQQGINLSDPKEKTKAIYLGAKGFFYQQNYSKAASLFRSITGDQKYGPRALFFLGLIAIKTKPAKEAFPLAEKYFQRALERVEPKEKDLKEYILMSLGRIYLEQGDTDKALEYYRQVDRRSKLFDTALYEVSWAYIIRAKRFKKKKLKEREYRRALQTLELLLAFLPESPLYPRAQLLMAHIQLELAPFQKDDSQEELFAKAMQNYRDLAKRYRTIYREMDRQVQAYRSPEQFFQNLIARHLEQFSLSSLLPRDTVRWMSDEELMDRTFSLLKDLKMMKKYLRDSFHLIEKLEKAISMGDKIDISPSIREARLQGEEIKNEILEIQRAINKLRQKLVLDKMSSKDREQYIKITKRLETIRGIFLQLPKNKREYSRRDKIIEDKINALQQRLHAIKLQLNYATKFVEVLRNKWLLKYPEARKLTTSQRNTLYSDADQLEQMIRDLHREYQAVKHEIELASIELKYAASDPYEYKVRAEYKNLLEQQRKLLEKIASQLSPDERGQLSELQKSETELHSFRRSVRHFMIKLRNFSNIYRKKIQKILDIERKKLREYKKSVQGLVDETKGLAAQIAYNSFMNVRKQFYNLVLKAEVGVIDVAWSQHQYIQKNKSRLLKERSRDLKILREEFREIIEEVEK